MGVARADKLDISVIIPTYQRATKAAACVASLARQRALVGQTNPPTYEVLVGLDGPDAAAADAVRTAWANARGTGATGGEQVGGSGLRDDPRDNLRVVECPRRGQGPLRNDLLAMARGEIILFVNDDVVADADLLAHHLHAHRTVRPTGTSNASGMVSVLGMAEWAHPPETDDRLIDRLVRDTSMIFFYDQMTGGGTTPDRDWGFRHFWTLNLSVPAAALASVGGFNTFELTYGHEDLELGWRLRERLGMPLLFRPAARVLHDHRYRAAEILDREHRLGVASFRYARAYPEFGRALFGRDVTSHAELEYSRMFIEREGATAARLRETFLQLDDIAANPMPGLNCRHTRTIIDALYQQHLLLKRWEWRRGLLAGAAQVHDHLTEQLGTPMTHAHFAPRAATV